jgi:hypothetical protein
MFVRAVRLEHHIFAKHELRCCLLRSLAKSLGFLRAVDAIQVNAFRPFIVQHFDRVAINNGDDEAGELSCATLNYEPQDSA